jgi:hypothetical protein
MPVPPVAAAPTKSLFLEALTSDLGLADAISDLVDNCADAALRLRGKNSDYSGLEVHITFATGRFEIRDNCGGIDLDTAANILFRLGRPARFTETPGQVGRFGIGMKRDVFMMGDKITVESWTTTSHFKIDINLEQWAKTKGWDFKFSIYDDKARPKADRIGTVIEVTRLRPNTSQEFGLPKFSQDLTELLQKEQKSLLHRQLAIFINEKRLTSEPYRIKYLPDNLEPAFFVRSYNGKDPALNVQIVAGVEESKHKDAGWYVACNGRFILVADKTSKTGWGEEDAKGELVVPKAHQQFARFRGYVFFESDDPKRLPWNSTKTGLNTDSHVYREVRQLMVSTMRPVITFLNRLDAEKESDARPLQKTLETAESRTVSSLTAATLTKNRSFKYSGIKGQADPDQPIRISYVKRLAEVQKVRRKLRVDENREIGRQTFDYFFDHEIRGKT